MLNAEYHALQSSCFQEQCRCAESFLGKIMLFTTKISSRLSLDQVQGICVQKLACLVTLSHYLGTARTKAVSFCPWMAGEGEEIWKAPYQEMKPDLPL